MLTVEAPRVGDPYEKLVRRGATRVASPHISKAWDEPPLAADADVHTGGIGCPELKSFDEAYLGEVSDHLSLWPWRISAKWRGRK